MGRTLWFIVKLQRVGNLPGHSSAVFLYESGPMVFVRYNREVQPFPRERVKVTVPGLDYGSNNCPLSWLTIPAPDKTSPAIPLQPLENMVSSTVLGEE